MAAGFYLGVLALAVFIIAAIAGMKGVKLSTHRWIAVLAVVIALVHAAAMMMGWF